MNRYASQTSVAPERSRMEIERTCARYGATGFVYGYDDGRGAMVAFQYADPPRRVRFILPLPVPAEAERTETGRRRHGQGARERAHALETRRRWRALALAIKAKLETVASGIATFDDEFLAYLVLPGGATVGERLARELPTALDAGRLPPLLAAPPKEA